MVLMSHSRATRFRRQRSRVSLYDGANAVTVAVSLPLRGSTGAGAGSHQLVRSCCHLGSERNTFISDGGHCAAPVGNYGRKASVSCTQLPDSVRRSH